MIRSNTASVLRSKLRRGNQVRTLYGIFHHEGRSDPIFKPQYGEHGENLNDDDVWHLRPLPPCSLTGKPRRQLGHTPRLGHPIVPYHRLDYKAICDNNRTPTPWWDEPRDQVGLKEINWYQIKFLMWIALAQWLYVTKHFFREADELHMQRGRKTFPYSSALWFPTPNYWYRPNHPEKRWMTCNHDSMIEQTMAWDRWQACNNTGVYFNMWLEPIEYDQHGQLLVPEGNSA